MVRTSQVTQYNFQTSLFDVQIISVFRSLTLILCYCVCKYMHYAVRHFAHSPRTGFIPPVTVCIQIDAQPLVVTSTISLAFALVKFVFFNGTGDTYAFT